MTKTLKIFSILAGLFVVFFLAQSSRVAAHAAAEPPDRAQPAQYLISPTGDAGGSSKFGLARRAMARTISISRSARGKFISKNWCIP